jgi:hypothetical protein
MEIKSVRLQNGEVLVILDFVMLTAITELNLIRVLNVGHCLCQALKNENGDFSLRING